MRTGPRIQSSLLGAALLGSALALARADTNGPPPLLPDAATVITRVVRRAAEVAKDTHPYEFQKHTRLEELDDRGRSRKTRQKEYAVTQVGGVTHARLLSVDGKPRQPTSQEARREEEAKQRWTQSSQGRKRGPFEQVLTEELFQRFQFAVEARDVLAGRACVRLKFRPREGELKADKLADRVINRLGGVLWVDEQDWEIVRAELRLTERVSVWGGMVGALDRFTLDLARARDPGGVWFVNRMVVELSARKLFGLGALRFRVTEQAEGFRKSGGDGGGD